MAGVLSVSLVYQRRGGLSRDTGAGRREDFSWIYEKQTCQYSVGPEIHRDAADQAVFKEKENGRLEAPLLGAVPDAWELLAVEGGILERAVGVLHLRAGGTHSDAPGGVKGRVSGLQIPD